MAKAGFLASVRKATAANKINSAIIFGEYGTGKTWLAASADEIADYSPVLIVDIEGSTAGVGRKYPEVDIVEADTYDKLEALRDMLLNDDHPYKTVVFDTFNVAQNRAYQEFKAANPGNKFGVWDDLKTWSMNFAREMHHAPFLTIFIAHPQVDTDESTGKRTITVKLQGQSRTEVPTVPDLIGYVNFETDDEGAPVRVLHVGRSSSIVTKNRFGLDDKLYNPTIKSIQQAILAAQDGVEND